ncbi:hypothetical protein [Tessaracoccus coleopterorum]|uniref:hypothetical protein n=1 Tax=Tessaracoccus coleopterorum TaxID=2714950 RepID=UPI001E4AFB0E|nr:hypothetical protein [Tessaracoccus coleopterorum]
MQGQVGLHLLQLGRVDVGVDPLPQLLLPTLEVLLGQLSDGLDGERSRAKRGLAHAEAQDLLGGGGVAVLVQQLSERLGDGELRQHLGV